MKIGDVIICINNYYLNDSTCLDSNCSKILTISKKYQVRDIIKSKKMVEIIDDSGKLRWHYTQRFKKLSKERKEKLISLNF